MGAILEKTSRYKKTNIYKRIEISGIDEVEKGLYSAVSDGHGTTYEICTGLIGSGGKRIRPLLVLCAAQCFGPIKPAVIHTAVACELIHMASLVHDDIIDESALRRNKPSVNAQIGNQSSVLVGDYLFAKAFEVLSNNNLLDSMNLVVEAIREMCDGEIAQANNLFNLKQTMEDYYNRIYKKTGILMAACCQAGAAAGGANMEQTRALRLYGTNLGYAFQIIDDILDFTGDKKMLGKPVGSDLKEGNITLPILKLIEQREYKTWLEELFYKKDINPDNFKEVLRVLEDSYAIQESYLEAEKCIDKAKSALDEVEDSEFKMLLTTLADQVLNRKN